MSFGSWLPEAYFVGRLMVDMSTKVAWLNWLQKRKYPSHSKRTVAFAFISCLLKKKHHIALSQGITFCPHYKALRLPEEKSRGPQGAVIRRHAPTPQSIGLGRVHAAEEFFFLPANIPACCPGNHGNRTQVKAEARVSPLHKSSQFSSLSSCVCACLCVCPRSCTCVDGRQTRGSRKCQTLTCQK